MNRRSSTRNPFRIDTKRLSTLSPDSGPPHNERGDVNRLEEDAMKIVKDSAARAATLLPEEGEVIAEGLNLAFADVHRWLQPRDIRYHEQFASGLMQTRRIRT